MQQRNVDAGELTKDPLPERQAFFEGRKTRWDGSPSSLIMRSAKEDTSEQRETELERLWQQGGFAFWTSNYMDLFVDPEANRLIYEFWKRKVRSCIQDKNAQEALAPEVQPYAFGTKRVPLEQGYYKAFNLPHVSLVDIKSDAIQEIKSNGILLASGKLIELDILILATGFDISTGSFTQIDIRGTSGQQLAKKWAERPRSYLGLFVSGFPNMLFSYGPHSPSNTCNGPVCAEVQGDWIVDIIEHARKSEKQRLEAAVAAEEEYTDAVTALLKGTLFEGTKAYYHRDNISHAGKREPIFWMGGLPAYIEKLHDCAQAGYAGLVMS
jgi:cation diffusion facilitator CzcD-associated flavoprotein CzcO